MWAHQTVIQKKQLAEKVFTTIEMIGNWLLSLFRFFHSYRVKERSPAKVGVGLEQHLKRSAFSMNTTNFLQKHWIVSKTKNALLFVGEFFLEISKIQFPRERVTNLAWSVSEGSWLGFSELKLDNVPDRMKERKIGTVLSTPRKASLFICWFFSLGLFSANVQFSLQLVYSLTVLKCLGAFKLRHFLSDVRCGT